MENRGIVVLCNHWRNVPHISPNDHYPHQKWLDKMIDNCRNFGPISTKLEPIDSPEPALQLFYSTEKDQTDILDVNWL
jgi:hypothetical protein